MDHPHTNRLIDSSSPYLLQHAHNPVDWYPWDKEALEKAVNEDKPIILSIGYSACHWCHVMERESFENEAIAQIMNEHFVCIKVDREERPDVDQVYMEAVHAMGLQGGWPLNVFLTPDQRPFYGGTYFPAKGWTRLLDQIANVFQSQREELEKSADGFHKTLSASEIKKYGLQQGEEHFDPAELPGLLKKLSSNFDTKRGGMDRAPKFPMPSIYAFLLRLGQASNLPEATNHGLLTLDQMAWGGIYDQIGGGWARYSTDAEWFAPHFEKMLYDNGQLVSLYSEAFSIEPKPLYKEVVYQTIDWLEREMLNPDGGFYAALDADSEGEEGKFYCWLQSEFEEILGPDAAILIDYYGLNQRGNWEPGKNILHRQEDDASFAQKHSLELDELKDLIRIAHLKLMKVRDQRIRPGLDDKTLSGWNGLMLQGLVQAYGVFSEERFLKLALSNASFLVEKMKSGDRLWHNYKEGKASIDGYLEDYAAVIQAFISLYEITFDSTWLEEAKALTDYTIKHFFDQEEGFFFFTDDSSEKLIARKKELFDNVIPASNSIMASNLYRLGIVYDESSYQDMAKSMLGKVKKMILTEPQFLANWASLLTQLSTPTAEVVIVGPEATSLALELKGHFIPNTVFVGKTDDSQSDLALLENRVAVDEKTTIYVCYNKACQLPVHTSEEALALIRNSQQIN